LRSVRSLSLMALFSLAITVTRPVSAQEAGDPSGPSLALTEAQAMAGPVAGEAEEASDDVALAEELYALRLGDREARLAEGWVLVGYGGASIATGAVLTGVGASNGDDRLLWAGLGTLGWGAINAVFSVFLMDLSGSTLHDIEADRSARGDALTEAREDAARDQWNTATVIAFNAGLDFFYVATGILLAILGETAGPGDFAFGGREPLIGYGAAMAAQGAGLLIYDVVTWLFAQDRGDRLLRMAR
jgi:hypothetical protein